MAAASAKPSVGSAGTTTLPTSVVGSVRATQNPARPGSATTLAPSGRAAPRSAAARAGESGTASLAYRGCSAFDSASYKRGRTSSRVDGSH